MLYSIFPPHICFTTSTPFFACAQRETTHDSWTIDCRYWCPPLHPVGLAKSHKKVNNMFIFSCRVSTFSFEIACFEISLMHMITRMTPG